MNFAVSSFLWEKVDFWVGLDKFNSFGIDQVEIFFSYLHGRWYERKYLDQVKSKLKKFNIKISSSHLPFRDLDFTNIDPSIRKKSQGEIMAGIESASYLGCKYGVLHLGKHNQDSENRWNLLEQKISFILEKAREENIIIAVENMPPGYFFSSAKNIVEWLNKHSHPNLGICIDLGHTYMNKDWEELIDQTAKRIVSIHLHDSMPDGPDHLPLGQGTMPLKEMLTKIKAVSPQVLMVLEVSGEEQNYPHRLKVSLDWLYENEFLR